MGRRARNRVAAVDQPPPPPRQRPQRQKRDRALDTLNPARKTIAAYLVVAGIVGVLALAGIATLGGLFGPIIVFGVTLALAAIVIRTVAQRIEGLELSEEDRLMRLLATGVLITAVVLTFTSAVVGIASGG